MYSARTTRRRKTVEGLTSAHDDIGVGETVSTVPAAPAAPSTALTAVQTLEPSIQTPQLSFPDFSLELPTAWPIFPDQEINYDLLDLTQFPYTTQELAYPLNTPSPPSLLPTDIFSQPPTIPTPIDLPPTFSELNTHLLTHQADLPTTLSHAPLPLRILALDQIFSLTRAFIRAVQSAAYPFSSVLGADGGDGSTGGTDADADAEMAYGSSLTALLAIYTALFGKMRVCAGDPDAVVDIGGGVDWELAMPEMRFGGYVPRRGFWGNDAGRGRGGGGGGGGEDGVREENTMRGYAMQYMMLVMLCTRLCEGLKEAVDPVGRGTLRMQFVDESVGDVVGYEGRDTGGGLGEGWTRLEEEMKRTKDAALVFVGGCLCE